MNQHPENYLQEYYENTNQIYEGYHGSEFRNFQGNCGDALSLQVPNTELYTEVRIIVIYAHINVL